MGRFSSMSGIAAFLLVMLAAPACMAAKEKFQYQSETNRLMDILVNSLYSNKDIFLRELISNACDALDKIRFLSLSDPSMLGDGDQAKLDIQIWLEDKTLYIRDRGIGMTKDDLVKNLGTIAKSGTSGFLEAMQKGGDINLIGQFGVGFYSVFLVSENVEVVSKHNNGTQQVWASSPDGGFTIEEDKVNEPLGRGTLLKIHLKPEALEYSEESKLRELVARYSEFMNFPIYIRTEKEVDVPIDEEAEEEASDDKEEEEGEEEAEEGVADEKEEAEPEKKTRKEKRQVWDLLNDNKAIWLRKASDVTKEEYDKFYKAISKNFDEPLSVAHFKAEGDAEFKSVLFIPSTAPYDFYDKYHSSDGVKSIKLYVRRVFISDELDTLIPRYLQFVRGIVDSDTLPLQVSREVLQQSATLKTIKKKLIRKVLDMVKKLADDEATCNEPAGEEEEEESEKISPVDCAKFGQFWKQFGRSIKMGVIEDTSNRNRLAKLLRFPSSKTGDNVTSLDEYISRMKLGQQSIYFLTGRTTAEIAKSPYVERLIKKGYEVIYMDDVLDEYLTQHLLEFDDKKFVDVSKEDLKLTDKDDKEKKRDKELKEEFKDFAKWWKDVIGADKFNGVKVSNRLTSTPCVVVSGKYGQSANMERIQRAQAFGKDNAVSNSAFAHKQRSLEINPRHPLIKGLKDKVTADPESASAKKVASLLWETALLESGFAVEDPKEFSQRVYDLAKDTIGLESLDNLEEEVEEAEDEAAEETAEEVKEEL